MMTNSNLPITLAMVGFIACSGCQSSRSSTSKAGSTSSGVAETFFGHHGPEIDVVRDGVLTGYNSTTVGKAFEGTFQNAKWSSFETAKGATIVEFKGTMKLSMFTDLFGCSPACQKRLDDFHDNCVTSEHLEGSIAAMTKADKERSEAFDRFLANLSAQRNALVPALNVNARDREVRMAEWCHENNNEAVCKPFFETFAFATPESKEQFYALSDQIRAAQIQYRQESELSAKQKQEMQTVIAKCITARRDEAVMPVDFQFTLNADKQSFSITDTDVGGSMPNILAVIYH